MSDVELNCDVVKSPIGDVLIVERDGKLVALDFVDCTERTDAILDSRFKRYERRDVNNPGGFSDALNAYFEGDENVFDDIDVDTGGTEFQQQVWSALRDIGWGKTSTYGELAERLGKPTASRAVGAANGQNPVALVLPCHRVIGANGQLTGYAGGLQRKQWLLRHEGSLLL